MSKKDRSGFTLLEILIVIAIIAIVLALVYATVDPFARFKAARDARRWSDAENLLNAIKVNQVDNSGHYISAIESLPAATVFMIGTSTSACDSQNANCLIDPASSTACVDLSQLISSGYIGALPVSPRGNGTWNASLSGYTLQKNANGSMIVRACENEGAQPVSLTR
ncbi:MAG: prepilin-type N-terminal cleavage/methylation domain-containing protein [Candidatus Falkowbacteria bacterium]